MNKQLAKVEDWLSLARKANWSVHHLARSCNVSVRTLERYFATTVQCSPKQWINEQRHKLAISLLREGFSVKHTAYLLGYRHAPTFSREFKAYWGYYPTSYHLVPEGIDKALPDGTQSSSLGA